MKGFEGYMGVLAMMRGAMPDIQWKIEETISEGDKILVRYTMTGTQTQPLMGMPATGKNSANVNFSTECSMIRISSSRR
ncbi:MAG: ester cyclase [Prevotella sp.]|nr:ester cyclase [Prevotella sp.]